MVEIVKKNLFFCIALLVAVFLYSGLFSIKTKSLNCIFQTDNDFFLIGEIVSDPQKINGKKPMYKTLFLPSYALSIDGKKSTLEGKVNIMFPSTLVEAYHPGKLKTDSKNKNLVFIDKGSVLKVRVKGKNGFYNALETETAVKSEHKTLCILENFRILSRLHFKRLMYAWGKSGGLFLALLSGSKEYLDPSVSSAFRDAGLSHVLALSGMHLSLFSCIALFFGKFFGGKKAGYVFQLCAVLIFVWFAGLSPSLFRALLCSLILSFSKLFKVNSINMLNVLSLAFLIHVGIRVSDAFEIAFILSYGALLGIILLNMACSRFSVRFLPSSLYASLSESVGAQTFTAPISLKVFNAFMPIGVFASVVVSPLVVLFIYFGLIFSIISLIFPFFSAPSHFLIKIIYNVIEKIVIMFSVFPSIKI